MVYDFNYFTKVLKRIMYFLIILIFLFYSFKLIVFYIPFLIAFIISLLLEPCIRFIMRTLKFKRKISSIIVLIIFLGIIITIIVIAVGTIISEGSNLLNNFSSYVSDVSNRIKEIINEDNFKKLNIPTSVITMINNSSQDLIITISTWLENTIKGILSFISSLPTLGLYVTITLLSLYFLCSDKVYMLDQIEHHLPELWVRKLYKHLKSIIKVFGKYLKAQSILILISFIISLVGLYFFKNIGLNIKYPFLYALGIGFVDALPIFGSGTVMLPWGIISSFSGDIKLGISIFILWITMSLVRQFLEPKIVSKHIGIHPIFTLIAMYTGFKFLGVIGLFLGPIILIILKNIFATTVDNGIIKSIFSRDFN